MGIRWTQGSLDTLRASVETFGEKAALAAIDALEESIEQGRQDVRARILDAPPTGKRPEGGPRWDTGKMFYDVDKNVTTQGVEKITGSFGWLDYEGSSDRNQEKISAQELGTERVTRMNALFPAFVGSLARFRQELAARGFKIS